VVLTKFIWRFHVLEPECFDCFRQREIRRIFGFFFERQVGKKSFFYCSEIFVGIRGIIHRTGGIFKIKSKTESIISSDSISAWVRFGMVQQFCHVNVVRRKQRQAASTRLTTTSESCLGERPPLAKNQHQPKLVKSETWMNCEKSPRTRLPTLPRRVRT
jgi:hypothetical protein